MGLIVYGSLHGNKAGRDHFWSLLIFSNLGLLQINRNNGRSQALALWGDLLPKSLADAIQPEAGLVAGTRLPTENAG